MSLNAVTLDGGTFGLNENERRHAALVRGASRGANVLFHGTRYARAVLLSDVLQLSSGSESVCMTRSPEVAAYYAGLERDDDEGLGCVLILSLETLRRTYRVSPHHDTWCDLDCCLDDEMEERIYGRDVVDLAFHLRGFVWEPPQQGLLTPAAKHALASASSKITGPSLIYI